MSKASLSGLQLGSQKQGTRQLGQVLQNEGIEALYSKGTKRVQRVASRRGQVILLLTLLLLWVLFQ